jgi:hypothetical protein
MRTLFRVAVYISFGLFTFVLICYQIRYPGAAHVLWSDPETGSCIKSLAHIPIGDVTARPFPRNLLKRVGPRRAGGNGHHEHSTQAPGIATFPNNNNIHNRRPRHFRLTRDSAVGLPIRIRTEASSTRRCRWTIDSG